MIFGHKREIERLAKRIEELEAMLVDVRHEADEQGARADQLSEACAEKNRELQKWRDFAADARLHLQNILSELKEAKQQGREVSASRVRREVKKVMRWFYEE